MHCLQGRLYVSIRDGHLGLLWAAIPHQLVRVDEPVICHWVTLPLAWFLQWQLPSGLTQAVLHGELVLDGDAVAELDLTLFKRWAQDMKANSAELRKIVLLEIEARMRRLALNAERGARPRPRDKRAAGRGALGKVEQMANFIAEHYTEELRVGDIAEAASLHPNYAMTLFRRTFGLSLVDYLTQHRISHAQRLLATSEAKVLDVALESGFGSLSRFYAAFSDSCGQSPRQYRLSVRAPR